MKRVSKGQEPRPEQKRFAVGTNVRIIIPGLNGVVRKTGTVPAQTGEYWHDIEYQSTRGTRLRTERGSNLELISQPITNQAPVFNEIWEQAISMSSPVERAHIFRHVSELEDAIGTPSWAERYQEFTAFVRHQSIYDWLIPILDRLVR